MTPQIYLRSPRPDGYWEVVTRDQFNSIGEQVKRSDYRKGKNGDIDFAKYREHQFNCLASLPVTHLIHPELGKANGIGWLVKEWEEKMQCWGIVNATDEQHWKDVDYHEWRVCPPDRRRKIIVAKLVEAQANYHQVVPDSHYWDSIDSLINYLSYQKARAVDIDYLITGFKNSLKNGYDICPSQPAEKQGQEEGKDEFAKLEWEVGKLIFDNLNMYGPGTAIECNTAAHAIAEYVHKLIPASHPVTDEAKEIERLEGLVKELENKIKFLENQGNAY